MVAKLHHHIQQVTKLAHFNISVEGGYVGVVNMFLIKPLQSIFRLFTNSIFGVVSSRARLNSLLSFVTSRVAGMPSAVMETIAQIAAA